MHWHRLLSGIAISAGGVVLVGVASWIGGQFAGSPGGVAVFWPGNAVIFGLLLWLPSKAWGWLVPGILIGDIGASLLTGLAPGMAVGYGLGDLAETGAAVAVMQLFRRYRLPHGHEALVAALVAYCLVLDPVYATIAVLAMPEPAVNGTLTAILTWVLVNAVAAMALTPVFAIAAQPRLRLRWRWDGVLVGLFLAAMAVDLLCRRQGWALTLVLLPLLGVALRFGFAGAAVANLLLLIGNVTAVHWGLFATGGAAGAAGNPIVDLQLDLLATVLSALLLGLAVERIKAAREDSDRQRRRAMQADRAKSHFLASMSHELRTPLNAINGFSELLELELYGDLNGKQREYITAIRTASDQLVRLINDILDLAKIDAGRIRLQEEPCQLSILIGECTTLIADLADRRRVRVVAAAGYNGDILADPVRIRQILCNIVTNAVKFTDPGGQVVIASRIDPASGGLHLTVTDNGIGMTAEQVALAVTPFGQVEGMLVRNQEGVGLGLPIAIALTEAHGGHLIIDSQPQAGTCITIRLPRRRVLAPPPVAADPGDAADPGEAEVREPAVAGPGRG